MAALTCSSNMLGGCLAADRAPARRKDVRSLEVGQVGRVQSSVRQVHNGLGRHEQWSCSLKPSGNKGSVGIRGGESLRAGQLSRRQRAALWAGRQGTSAAAAAASGFEVGVAGEQRRGLKVEATVVEPDGWWTKNPPENMTDIHSTQDLVDAMAAAGDKLVVVEFFGTWCGACKALFPKLKQLAKENKDVVFLKVPFDENKALCRSLQVKVLPYFHFYRGAQGRVEAFSASLSKIAKIRAALKEHGSARCSLGAENAVAALGDLPGLDGDDESSESASASATATATTTSATSTTTTTTSTTAS